MCFQPNERLPRSGGFMRLPQIVGPNGLFPVSRSTWWQGIKEGRYPAPVKLSRRISAWNRSDIEDLLEKVRGE